ncbi:MAG: hypothetical protein E7540_00910 [Ruminococcaceae bacterium]|nr:hypothetical protein [Oscillospiraceae bacterium]
MNNSPGLIILLSLFILVLILIVFIEFLGEFTRELKYLNMEVRRAKGQERRFWLKKRRRLWLSLIPFVKR